MKKTPLLILIADTLIIIGLLYWVFFSSVSTKLGATILSTDTTDTIGTFRTNVNTSLTNLNNAIAAITGAVSTSTAITAGYIPVWATSAGALTGTSTIFQSGSSIGIGTIAPSSTLHVVGNFNATATSTFSGAILASSTIQVTGTSTLSTATVSSVLRIPNASAGPTLAIVGDIGVDSSASSSFNFFDGTAERVLKDQRSLSFSITSPTATENAFAIHFDFPVTITKVACINRGTGSTVTFQMPHGTDRSSSGTNLFSSGQACTATTAETELTTFNDATLAADEVLWLTTSAASSTEFMGTVYYRYDVQ